MARPSPYGYTRRAALRSGHDSNIVGAVIRRLRE
jgi:hypothetical protein